MKQMVSVIVPIYKVETTIERCINSIIEQTYRNLEIILVDDGSPDNSGKICDRYAQQEKRIKVLHKKNAGVSAARNDGLSIATGEYITFIDSDDYISRNMIYNLMSKKDDSTYDLIVENAIDFDNTSEYKYKVIEKDLELSIDDYIKELFIEQIVSTVCWGKLYKKSLLKDVKFDTKYRIAEDFDFVMSYLDKCKQKILLISNLDYYYYLGQGSAIRSGYNEKWNDEFQVCEQFINKYKGTKLEIYAIKRFIRINVTCLTMYELNKNEILIIKSRIKKYKKSYLKSNKINNIDKMKLILAFYFPKIMYKIKKRVKGDKK